MTPLGVYVDQKSLAFPGLIILIHNLMSFRFYTVY